MLKMWPLAPTGFEVSIQNTTRNVQKKYYITDLQGTVDFSQTILLETIRMVVALADVRAPRDHIFCVVARRRDLGQQGTSKACSLSEVTNEKRQSIYHKIVC
jgi:hypothetical protein